MKGLKQDSASITTSNLLQNNYQNQSRLSAAKRQD